MKPAVKDLHAKMMTAEKAIKAEGRQMRYERGAMADDMRKDIAAKFRASYVARKAMRDGAALAAMERHIEDKAKEAVEEPLAADDIKRELFYIVRHARIFAQVAGEQLPPIFADWGALAGQLDAIGRRFIETERDPKFAKSWRPSYDFVIHQAGRQPEHWTIEAAFAEIRHCLEAGERRDLETAEKMERALQFWRSATWRDGQQEKIDNFLRTLYEERARI